VSPRLLLVDDADDIRLVARISLERIGGWEVVDAASGEAALAELVASGPFDAIVLDVMMPGLDGPTTLQLLRATRQAAKTPVVFLTAKIQPADRERLGRLGAAGTIEKPFDPVTLPSELAALIADAVPAAIEASAP
jgi:two-component system, OmpR family, response regulator